MRIRTALVTARSAPAHERAIRTLMDWHIEVDEAMFLGGLPKGEFLREFEPDFFFDDQTRPRRVGRGARAGGARGGGGDQPVTSSARQQPCPRQGVAAQPLEVEHAHAAVFDADHAAQPAAPAAPR